MTNILKTKLVGSAIFTLVVFGVGATTYGVTQAQLIAQGTSLTVSGAVSAVNTTDKTITITTDDASPITFGVNFATKFGPNPTKSLSDISVGDSVVITGTQSANNHGAKQYTASNVKELGSGPGYGTNNNKILVETGKVNFIDVAGGNFTVQFGTTYANFEVHSTTKFNGKTFKQLKVGDTVTVTGEDTGTYFLADKVVVAAPVITHGYNQNGNGYNGHY